MTTNNPLELSDATTWYLVTNLPVPTEHPTTDQQLASPILEEVIKLYGLRMWIEQSYRAMRQHWQMVCCALSFCWYHPSHSSSRMVPAVVESPELSVAQPTSLLADGEGMGKNSASKQENNL